VEGVPAVRDARGVSGRGGALALVDEAIPNLARDRGNFFTRAAAASDVYGELVREDERGQRWRRWDPYRSKFAAALHEGGLADNIGVLLAAPSVLYLGAASGTTVSHLADIVAPRSVFAVEFAPRPFQDLLEKLRPWGNVMPVLADARRPEEYRAIVGEAGALVQDVAQPGQVDILVKNADAFLHEGAPVMLFLKARSEDSAMEPEAVYRSARAQLAGGRFLQLAERRIDRYDKDHRAYTARWNG
jgi:fibrillarin-like pre-rRNA processing protein